ncbi:MAG: class I SAM-dependent methyltransferase [Planctomycetes bacterium]|nr:class I SAM-dependent methyltransferase [Planctomycetota bacterium]
MTEIYNNALYYDILFGWDRTLEALFYDAAFQILGLSCGDRLLETGCGTGTIALKLAKYGWRVSALDIKEEMLSFLRQREEEESVSIDTVLADMTAFTLSEPVDGAYCPMGSMGHLMEDEQVINHFRAVGKNLKAGGIYIADVGLAENETYEWDYGQDEWEMERDGIGVVMKDKKLFISDPARGEFTLDWDARLRLFNPGHLASLATESGILEVVTWYPEADMTDEGISIFDATFTADYPEGERAMLACRKLS